MSRNKKLYGLFAAGAAIAIAAAAITVTTTMAGGGGDDNEAPITGEALEKASAAALAHTGGGSVAETEVGDEESLYEVEVALDNGDSVDVQLDESFNVVGSEADSDDAEDEGDEDGDDAAEDDDNDAAEDADEQDVAIGGDALAQASAAALAFTGGGTVTETEVGDEESYYEVEVTMDDGTQVDVQLDEAFNVVGSESEDGGDDD